jgi:hypothetical protein
MNRLTSIYGFSIILTPISVLRFLTYLETAVPVTRILASRNNVANSKQRLFLIKMLHVAQVHNSNYLTTLINNYWGPQNKEELGEACETCG